ncbi:Formamidopyrimidine-DNA glycosylase N-terminal domain-containing protein [Infundibulicybe gibba]|nr:Formamidopyrimidine-DNA glycosylase N-terminal domain-containing protein [Infundibulicybe gibba]
MPELPEVERAAGLIRRIAVNKRIESVETTEDSIVFSGTTSQEFASQLTGRTVKDAKRYGKVFYLTLDGDGKMPVLHFGMTGMLQVKGEIATYYKETPKTASTDWPPRFMKFILHLVDDTSQPPERTQVAFLDARRLGRIRLCALPLEEPPISGLGFDPILSMPSLEEFSPMVSKRSCPIKALLLDQSFSAGVGNWVADEILYHARVHPEQRCNTLTPEQLEALHTQTAEVCRFAVSVNADDHKFPDHWLFKHRWGKGKKKQHTLKLPSGEPATIKWLTVGGRTSAFVVELQKLPENNNRGGSRRKRERVTITEDAEDSDSSALTEDDAQKPSRKRKVWRKLIHISSALR